MPCAQERHRRVTSRVLYPVYDECCEGILERGSLPVANIWGRALPGDNTSREGSTCSHPSHPGREGGHQTPSQRVLIASSPSNLYPPQDLSSVGYSRVADASVSKAPPSKHKPSIARPFRLAVAPTNRECVRSGTTHVRAEHAGPVKLVAIECAGRCSWLWMGVECVSRLQAHRRGEQLDAHEGRKRTPPSQPH